MTATTAAVRTWHHCPRCGRARYTVYRDRPCRACRRRERAAGSTPPPKKKAWPAKPPCRGCGVAKAYYGGRLCRQCSREPETVARVRARFPDPGPPAWRHLLAAVLDLVRATGDPAHPPAAIAEAAWRRAPADFGMKGRERDYPSDNRTVVLLAHKNGPVRRGLLRRVGPGRYALTEAGLALAAGDERGTA